MLSSQDRAWAAAGVVHAARSGCSTRTEQHVPERRNAARLCRLLTRSELLTYAMNLGNGNNISPARRHWATNPGSGMLLHCHATARAALAFRTWEKGSARASWDICEGALSATCEPSRRCPPAWRAAKGSLLRDASSQVALQAPCWICSCGNARGGTSEVCLDGGIPRDSGRQQHDRSWGLWKISRRGLCVWRLRKW